MNVRQATINYEKWKSAFLSLVPADLRRKHKLMRHSAFEFFRGTYYRWMQLWPEVCADLGKAPHVLAVGDSHIENFGTWRDAEGRLIWGCNDLDEAHALPYTLDLVRLAASAHLASDANHLSIRRRFAGDVILEGYRDALKTGGQPFVLGEHHVWLREIAVSRLRDPVHFWERMETQQPWKGHVPTEAWRGLEGTLRNKERPNEIKHRVAGIGSLGHRRIVFIVNRNGGRVAREAKELAPPAFVWASRLPPGPLNYTEIVNHAVRVCDPFLHVEGNWVFRRLAPDCSRIELFMLPARRDEERLLYAMGWETANIHLGSRSAIPAVKRDLDKRPARWLHRATKAMSAAIRRDWKSYRR
jgi:hypothetical protein